MSVTNSGGYGTNCSAVGCSMRTGTNLSSAIKMYRFPKSPSRRLHWQAALQRKNWKASDKSLLCNKHFISGASSDDSSHPDYIPSIFAHMKDNKSETSMNRYERGMKRRKVLTAPLVENDGIINETQDFLELNTKDIGSQTDITMSEMYEMEQKLHASHAITDEAKRVGQLHFF